MPAPSKHMKPAGHDHGGRIDAAVKKYGGTDLLRLYSVDNAAAWQDKLARRYIWSRTSRYSKTYLRLGPPASEGWQRLQDAV